MIEGAEVEQPAASTGYEAAPVRAYLECVTVVGFRGVGPSCELRLHPGPGLTLVVGRNGSGKSSIAEAAEFALTGDSLRWSGKTQDWRRGWRNLHAEADPQIQVRLRVDGEQQSHTVVVRWSGDDVESAETRVTVPGEGPKPLESLGWDAAIRAFRPFLSYTELSTITGGRPIDRYRALAPMLGMESLRPPIDSLRHSRLSLEKKVNTAKSRVTDVICALADCPDDRAAVAADALSEPWDLAKVEALVTGTEPAAAVRDRVLDMLTQLLDPDADSAGVAAEDLRGAFEKIEQLKGSDAERASKLADLLETAVEIHEHHGDTDCPVCGRAKGLDVERVGLLRPEIGRLRGEARAVVEAQKALNESRRKARSVIGPVPEVLDTATGVDVRIDLTELRTAWQAWIDTPDSDQDLVAHLDSGCLQLIAATKTVRSEAKKRQQQLADQWRPLAEKLTELLPIARDGQRAERMLPHVRKAESWLKRCEASIRDERFEEVNARVKEVWETLAVGSNVMLENVRLTARSVDMNVTVDGDRSAALGVMSQGELHALALSLFIPRVKFEDSPFGFAILDDPVQAMDPVRVDGLARVLHNLAKTHQVVVFTHDDRLPSTIRRLQIPASILAVTRRPKSRVELKKSLDPVQAAIEDARALHLTKGLPARAARKVVPGLCRQAIEAACLESGRRKMLARGMSLEECDQAWAHAVKLFPRIAIGLYGDAQRTGDVYRRLNNKFGSWAGDTARQCNEGTHPDADQPTDLGDLIDRAECLALGLAKL